MSDEPPTSSLAAPVPAEYLNSEGRAVRRPLARHARLELTRLVGQDPGAQARPWLNWLDAQPDPLPCQPWQTRTELEVAE